MESSGQVQIRQSRSNLQGPQSLTLLRTSVVPALQSLHNNQALSVKLANNQDFDESGRIVEILQYLCGTKSNEAFVSLPFVNIIWLGLNLAHNSSHAC